MRAEKLLSRKLESRLAKKQDEMKRQPAVFADVVIVPNQINYNYVVIGDKTMPVYNDRVPAHPGVKIWVGHDALDQSAGRPKRFQVLGTRSEDPTSGNSASFGYAPSARYEWMAKGGGQDMLNVHLRAISFLRVGVSASDGCVNIYNGKIWNGTRHVSVPRQDIDISTYVPTTAGKAAFVMISIDTNGTIVTTKGTEVDIADLDETTRPNVPDDTAYVSACVRVYYGQVKPQEGRVNTDFDDLRLSGWKLNAESVNISHLRGMARWSGVTGQTVFELPDISDGLDSVVIDGSTVDPLVYTMSDDGTQIILDTGLGSDAIVTSNFLVKVY